ncbi:MAG: SPOR domain-containing protein [Deltaproteobacteria bacterium]|nr:SPOR domain-containing protein [Deltaproteobacteria bacterium]
MKRVTTNITFGQILFILLTVVFASLVFFYLGAKFGNDVFSFSKERHMERKILPDEHLMDDIQKQLQANKHEFVFFEALQSKDSLKELEPTISKSTNLPEKEILQNSIQKLAQQESKEAELESKSKKEVSESKKEEPQKPVAQKEESQKVAVQKVTTNDQNKKTASLEIVQKKKPFVKEEPQEKKVVVKTVGQMAVKVADPKVITVGAQAAKDNKPEPAEEIQETVTPSSKYTLQIGSYATTKKAEKAVGIWRQRGFPAKVVSTEIKGKGKWYRLQLGGYPSMDAVLQAQRDIMSRFRQSSRIINL